MNITNIGDFRMALAATAKHGVRAYLNGLYLEPREGRVVGSDGVRLVRASCLEVTDADPLIICPYRVDRKTAKHIPVGLPKSAFSGWISVPEGTIYTQTRTGKTTKTPFDVVDERYPDLARVIPGGTKEWVEELTFNPLLLAEIVAARNDEALPGVRLTAPNGTEKAYVAELCGSQATIVIMPMRL